MSSALSVQLYVRAPAENRHSIERVFKTVADHLPSDVHAVTHTLQPSSLGVWGRLSALFHVRTRSPGVHHVTGDVHFLVLALPWRRTVLTVHDLVRLKELSGLRQLVYRLIWFSLPLRLAAAVTAVSDHTAQELLTEFPFVATKLHVITNPLPSGLMLSERPQTRSRRDRPMHPVILHVGTKTNKNLGLSIAVAKHLGAQLTILGPLDVDYREELEQLGVDYLAKHDVSDETLLEVYAGADLLLFPSFAEGFGMPIIEAQACCLPVVTSDVEPMRSVSGGAAVLIDPRAPEAAVEAVRRLLDDPDLIESLVEAGLANADRYSPRKVAEDYASVYWSVARAATKRLAADS